MGAHANGTEDPYDQTALFNMDVSNITDPSYDLIVYLGANDAQFGDGTGKISINGSAEQDFTLRSGEFSGFVEITGAATPGNYIVFRGLTSPFLNLKVWGNGFNHIGPTGFQIVNYGAIAADTTPPDSSSFNPADNSTGVAVGANIVASFSERIVAGTGNITIRNTSVSPNTNTSIDVNDATRITISGSVLTINSAADLLPNTNYAVRIATTAIDDLAGNSFAGIANNTNWNFTTGATSADTTAPTPNPMTFASPPAAAGPTSISMTATAATDTSGVEYIFNNVTLATSSPWQDSPLYTATGLSPATRYSFTAQARDKSPAQNPATPSASASAMTQNSTQPADRFNVNLFSTGEYSPANHGKVTLEAGESAGVGSNNVTGWQNIEVPFGLDSPMAPVSIASSLGLTASFTLKDLRNGWTYDSTPNTNVAGGSADLMNSHANGTEDPYDGSNFFDMAVAGIPYQVYDFVVYLGSNEAPLGDGTGKPVINGGAVRDFTLTPGEFNGFVEINNANTPGNYIIFRGLRNPSLTLKGWGNGFNHIGPTGFQIVKDTSGLLPPGPPSSPNPTDASVGHAPGTDLSWTGGIDAVSRNVYFGTSPTPGASQLHGNQTESTFDPGPSANGTYCWRIDEVNADGTTPGPAWIFAVGSPAKAFRPMPWNGMTAVATTGDVWSFTTPVNGANKVKIFILAGQSNMEGQGEMNPAGTPGTLQTIYSNDPVTYAHLKTGGNWTVRDDAWIWYKREGTTLVHGGLNAGYGANSTTIGPELQFGHAMGDYFGQKVLLIKTAWGGKSLRTDFRPPGSSWSRDEPVTDGDEGFYFKQMLDAVVDATANLQTYFPTHNPADGCEISGFAWHQGWNDRVTPAFAAEYEANMAKFIRDVRSAVGVPGLPFVIASTGMDGNPDYSEVELAQLQMENFTAYPEFNGNVAAIDTQSFWFSVPQSPADQGYHWNRHAGTYYELGKSMAQEMQTLIENVSVGTPQTPYQQWSAGPFPSGQPLTAPDPELDFDGGSLPTGIEWVVGGDPTDGSDDAALAPSIRADTEPGFHLFTYRFSNEAAADVGTEVLVEYAVNLSSWTKAIHNGDTIRITTTPGATFATVGVKLRDTLAPHGRLFVRPKATLTP